MFLHLNELTAGITSQEQLAAVRRGNHRTALAMTGSDSGAGGVGDLDDTAKIVRRQLGDNVVGLPQFPIEIARAYQ